MGPNGVTHSGAHGRVANSTNAGFIPTLAFSVRSLPRRFQGGSGVQVQQGRWTRAPAITTAGSPDGVALEQTWMRRLHTRETEGKVLI